MKVLFKITGLTISEHPSNEVRGSKDLLIEAKEEFCTHPFQLTKGFVLPKEGAFKFRNEDAIFWLNIKASDVTHISQMNGKAYPNIKLGIRGLTKTSQGIRAVIEYNTQVKNEA